MAQFLLGNGEKNYNYQTGQTAVLRLNVPQYSASYVVQPPSGDAVRMNADSLRQMITYPTADPPGNYVVFSGNNRSGMLQFQTGFSVIVPPQTWEMARMDQEQIKSVFGDRLKIIKEFAPFETGIASFRTGREFFPILLVLLLGVFLTEYVIANRFYRE
jgi:hypothetical protein